MKFRFAEERDIPALLAVYGQYIDTPITFECELPSEESFRERVRGIRAMYPYIVCEEGGRILGYAYAHRQAERAAYQWNAELSIYLDRDCTGQGLGRRLYGILIDLLRLQGIRTAYALVTVPNERSEGLHRGLGFRHMGTQRNTGYKNGAWRDVAWFEKAIAPYGADPAPPLPIGQVPAEQIAGIMGWALTNE